MDEEFQQIAERLLTALGQDNNSHFTATPVQKKALASAVRKMYATGCMFTDEQVIHLVAGERDEVRERFKNYNGFAELDRLLDEIFNNAE